MIDLGLTRITRLCRDTPIPWRAIHVAGTNGKGSVCAYASAMLNAGKIKCGRFTSPHLVDRWDCISINEKPVSATLFHEVEAMVRVKDQNEDIKASEFELLTAAAFEIFHREKIEVGIVEVGLGGRYDATNILHHPSITVITKIGLDHQALLGDTLEDIAYQKAGIMKKGAPCIVDGSNKESVLDVLKRNAREINVSSIMAVPQLSQHVEQIWEVLSQESFESHQQQNLYLAYEAVSALLTQSHPSMKPQGLLTALQDIVWPGRLQTLNITSLIGRQQEVLLDGAHNPQSADILGSYVNKKMRKGTRPVTWIVAMSNGKSIQELLSCIVQSTDNIVAVEFSSVDGMPWVIPYKAPAIIAAAQQLGISGHLSVCTSGLKDALILATRLAENGPLVIAGSLYLVSDVVRLLRQRDHSASCKV